MKRNMQYAMAEKNTTVAFCYRKYMYIAGIKEGTEFDIYTVYKVVRWVSYTSKSYTDVYIKKSGRR